MSSFLSLVQYSVFICSDIAHVLIDLKSLMQVFSLLKIVTLPVWPIKLDFLMTCEFDVCMYHSGSHVACVVYLMNYPHYLPQSAFNSTFPHYLPLCNKDPVHKNAVYAHTTLSQLYSLLR